MAVLKRILVLNGGSSSIKAQLYRFDSASLAEAAPPEPEWTARADFQHHAGEAELATTVAGKTEKRTVRVDSPAAIVSSMLEGLDPAEIDAAGHRIVHGGKAFRESTRITPEVKAAIVQLASFAPEHNLLEVEAIDAVEELLPAGTPQVAVFDTAFHATLAPPAYTYAGPYAWLDQGIRRYGFHGISHQYVSRRAAEILGRDLASLRMITCHLGNGCSLAAIRNGQCVQTTMGFTPLEGLVMGTRSGSVDPGILIHLVRHCGSTAEDLDRILNKESGLKGLSGVSGDMRDVLAAAASHNARAELAFAVYTDRLCAAIGSLLPALGGLDTLVFTAGVGENCAPLRAAAGELLAFLGLKIDGALNAAPAADSVISAADSRVTVLVVRTREEWEIAREVSRVLSQP